MDTLITRTEKGLPTRGLMLTGLRGVGKTVLLQAMRAKAKQAGWTETFLEGTQAGRTQENFRVRLARELTTVARKLARDSAVSNAVDRVHSAIETIAGFSIQAGVQGVGVSVHRVPTRANTGSFETDFAELAEDIAAAMASTGRGFVLFLDEMQDVESDALTGLLAAAHRAGQEGWPFFLIGAGLPNLPVTLAEARSYAERLFDYRQIGALPPPDAAAALLEPAREFGADYTTEALDLILDASGGYPYFLQEYGQTIWDGAIDNPFSASDAREAISRGERHLDNGFYRTRWDRATEKERDLLRAMSQIATTDVTTGAIAAQMRRGRAGISSIRATLISKGLVYAPDHGKLAFTVPGMAAFIQRQPTA